MFKFILSAALLIAASSATAGSEPVKTTNAASSRNIPVIVKNEVITPKLCRLHFEDGSRKDVACNANGKKS